MYSGRKLPSPSAASSHSDPFPRESSCATSSTMSATLVFSLDPPGTTLSSSSTTLAMEPPALCVDLSRIPMLLPSKKDVEQTKDATKMF